MSTKSNNGRQELFRVLLFLVFLIAFPIQNVQGQHWPIPQNESHFNRTNCTFGELHTGLHFHGAIDIDHDTLDQEAQAILHGRVSNANGNPNSQTSRYIEVAHESVPGSGDYDRRSIYMHLQPDSLNLNLNQLIQTGQMIGKINNGNNGGHHLHLMTWQRIDGDWYAINPLKNQQGWSVAELRDNQQQLIGVWGNAPIDETEPQVNQVFIKGVPQPTNNVASGYQILTSVGGIAHLRDSNNAPHAAQIHFHDRAGATTTNIPPYQPEQERLAVFGNIVTTAHGRDKNINGGDTGEGLTVHRMAYSVDKQLRYDVTFDRFQGNIPTTEGDDEDVFHYYYNQLTNQDDYGDPYQYDMGNNDYIRLYNAGATLNNCQGSNNSACPAAYLPVHKKITAIQSNGIWFTKAREGTPPVFSETPDAVHEAKINAEAQYPDGEHTLTFHVEDAAGGIDRAPNGREDNANVQVIVDNFRPYVQNVKITSGSDVFPMYSSAWNWETASRQLKLRPNAVNKKADMGQPLHIAVKTSEPMKLTTDANGQPNGSMKIKLFAIDPQDPNRIKVYLDWDDDAARPRSVNEEGTEWNFFVPHSQYANLTGGFENYTQFVQIKGTDLAGTLLTEYDGSQTTFTENQIPYRDPNAPQTWVAPTTAGYGNISGVDSAHRFLFGEGAAGFAATYGGTGSDETQALEPTFQCFDGVCEHNGYILAGHSDSFGTGKDIWVVKLSLSGDILEEWRFGGSGNEEAYAIHPTYAYVDVGGGVIQKQNTGYIVAGSTDSSGNGAIDALVIKLDENFGVTWANTYGDTGTERAYAIVQTASADGYVVAGQTDSFPSGTENGLALKLYPDGSLNWAKSYGRILASQQEGFYAIDETATGEFLLAGKSRNGKYGFWVVKMDGTGSIQNGGWAREFQDTGTNQNIAYAIDATSDGGAIVAGESTNKLAVLKLNSSGNLEWNNKTKIYGTGAFSPIDEGHAVQQTNDGGYLVAGLTASAGAGGSNAWLLKLDSNGDDVWQKTYGGLGTDEFQSIRALEGGGSIVAGRTTSFGAGSYDIFVVKTNQDGAVSGTSCAGETSVDVASGVLDLSTATFPDGSLISTMAAQAFTTITSQMTQGEMTSICGMLPCLSIQQGGTLIPYGGDYNLGPTSDGSSAEARFTLENQGRATLVLESGAITLVGSPELALVENFQYPVAIEPGNSESVTITFTPDPQTTSVQTAGVYITSNAPNSPYVFHVEGNQRHNLTVTSSAGGTVTGCAGVQQQCPEDPMPYPESAMVTLQAAPDQDFVFTGWTVDNQPMGLGNLQLAMTAPATVKAEFTRKKYIIAGRVAESNGNALVGIIMNAPPSNATTDANGFYSLVVDSGWTGTVTPEVGGFVLTLEGQQVENGQPYPDPVRHDILFQNYSAAIEVAVAGQVLLAGGTGLGDVLLDGFPGYVLTAADGTYHVGVPLGWSGNVTFTQAGYTFTPPDFTYANLTSDLSGQDAVGTGTPTFTISGQVTDTAGTGVGAVALLGFPGAPLTSSDGTYSVRVNSGWSGTITPQYDGGSVTPSSFTHTAVSSNRTQNYALTRQYPLTVALTGTGTGSVTSAAAGIDCGADCSETYAESTPVTLSAAPDTTSTFTGWSGGGCSGAGACVITLSQATEVSAVFTENTPQHTFTVVNSGDGYGTVLSMPTGILCGTDCTETVDDATTLTLRAIPSSDSKFEGWSGGGCSGTDDCAVTVTQDTIVTATFSPAATLIIEKAGAGTGTVIADGIDCGSTCENTYAAGTGVVLKAIPDAGSTFAGWQVNGQPSDCLVIIDGQTTVTATFEP